MTLEMKMNWIEVCWDHAKDGIVAAVVAKKHFLPGEIIEIAPIILLSVEDSQVIEDTNLREACFKHGDRLAVTGGYAAICHQSNNPNAVYSIFPCHRAVIIAAKKEIQRADIITIDRPGFPNTAIEGDFRNLAPWKHEGIVVRESPRRGLGVYATRPFKEGDHVEICH